MFFFEILNKKMINFYSKIEFNEILNKKLKILTRRKPIFAKNLLFFKILNKKLKIFT